MTIKAPPGPAANAASSSQAAGPVFLPRVEIDVARLNRALEILKEVATRGNVPVQLHLSLASNYILKAQKELYTQELEATAPR